VGQQTEQPETEKECRIPLVWKKSRNQKWVFEKNGLVKGKIRLNMPVFEAYGMTVIPIAGVRGSLVRHLTLPPLLQ